MAISEQGWLSALRPAGMLRYVESTASERKARLLGAACCRHVYGGVLDARAIAAVDIAERFADGLAGADELAVSHAAAGSGRGYWEQGPEYRLTAPSPAAGLILGLCTYLGRYLDERTAICNLIRDIFGNPFRPVAFDPSWRTSTVVALAQQMYESRDFSPMPVLADALQDAGCEHEAILAHCRGDGPHVRGCWVVDLILGKS